VWYGMVYRYGRAVLSNSPSVSLRGGCSLVCFFSVARSVFGDLWLRWSALVCRLEPEFVLGEIWVGKGEVLSDS
jgi:hypothetical protein